MRNVLVAVLFGVSLLGCGGAGEPTQPASGDVDMARASAGTGGNGGASGAGGGGGSGSVADMSHPQSSTDMAHGAGGSDMASGGDMAGLKPFGQPCTANAQCASDVCFIGGMQSFCSFHCTPATAATDCPVPPTTGVCNNQGYCK